MMETAVSHNMCRCCASEGAFKDVKTTYHWMGEEEIYADMLRECFDVNLNLTEECEENGICEVCITQLRNAINFKKQVLHTEEHYKKLVQNKSLYRSDSILSNIVKIEATADEDSEENVSADDGFSGPEYDVPIKTEEEEPKPKKRAAATKAVTRSKKTKADTGETSTKRQTEAEAFAAKILSRVTDIVPKTAKKVNSKDGKTNTIDTDREPGVIESKLSRSLKLCQEELFKQKYNIREILLSSNATPIRKFDIGFVCCFCTNQYEVPAELKTHTMNDHNDDQKLNFMKGKKMPQFLIRLDITDLVCTLCDASVCGVKLLIEHLKDVHTQLMFTGIRNYILPFKFVSTELKCAICKLTFNRFKVLEEHMYCHYRNFICNVCDMGFVKKELLTIHKENHKREVFKCKDCPKTFDTRRKRKVHEEYDHIPPLHDCPYCNKQFLWLSQKNNHIAEFHSEKVIPPKECKDCERTFRSEVRFLLHLRLDHPVVGVFKCNECHTKFTSKNKLKLHVAEHTALKKFKCRICEKTYEQKKYLSQHMRIHEYDRRFGC